MCLLVASLISIGISGRNYYKFLVIKHNIHGRLIHGIIGIDDVFGRHVLFWLVASLCIAIGSTAYLIMARPKRG